RVVFSAHGVSPTVHAEAAERSLSTIDATCPLVTKVHKEAIRFARDGFRILLVGHAGHEEVEGTMGVAAEQITLVQSPDEARNVAVPADVLIWWISQSILSGDCHCAPDAHLS